MKSMSMPSFMIHGIPAARQFQRPQEIKIYE